MYFLCSDHTQQDIFEDLSNDDGRQTLVCTVSAVEGGALYLFGGELYQRVWQWKLCLLMFQQFYRIILFLRCACRRTISCSKWQIEIKSKSRIWSSEVMDGSKTIGIFDVIPNSLSEQVIAICASLSLHKQKHET